METKDLIICHRCQTLHKKRALTKKEIAKCSECGEILYKSRKNLLNYYLSFSITALVFLLISLFFPILHINLSGFESSLSVVDSIVLLFSKGYDLVALFSLFILIIFPILIILFLFFISLFMSLKIARNTTKWLLIFVGFLNSWSMLDIFFISILVASVKIFHYATISPSIAFYSTIIYMVLEIYLTKHTRVEELWDEWEERYL